MRGCWVHQHYEILHAHSQADGRQTASHVQARDTTAAYQQQITATHKYLMHVRVTDDAVASDCLLNIHEATRPEHR